MKKLYKIYLLIVLVLSCIPDCEAQLDLSPTQHMNTQFFFNPAYTGVHEALMITTFTRRQMLGVDGAPQSYVAGVNSPINKSMASVGGGLAYETYGVYKNSHVNFDYARLVRLSKRAFLSYGFQGQISSYTLGLNQLEVNDIEDPYFQVPIDNKFAFNVGIGLLMYTPNFYIGLSVPRLLDESKVEESGVVLGGLARHYYFTTGYAYDLNKKTELKPAVVVTYAEGGDLRYILSAQLSFDNTFRIGLGYQSQNIVGANCSLVLKNLSLSYSYDFSINEETSYYSGHEVCVQLSIFSLYKRNRDRMFKRKSKKKDDEVDPSMKSLRYF